MARAGVLTVMIGARGLSRKRPDEIEPERAILRIGCGHDNAGGILCRLPVALCLPDRCHGLSSCLPAGLSSRRILSLRPAAHAHSGPSGPS